MDSVERLRDVLGSLERLLEQHRVAYATVIRAVNRDFRDAGLTVSTWDRIRAMFGGMGSLTDVYITKANGNAVDDEDAANETLDMMRSQLWRELMASEPKAE